MISLSLLAVRGSGEIAVAFSGDGATNIGAFHEALNLAAVWSLLVLLVCENNLYMEYTPIGQVTAVANPASDRAPAYGLPAEVIDVNDVVLVAGAMARAAARARAGGGPTVLEARTYRHFGHSRTDRATYRPAEEVQRWLDRDPLELARQRLAAAGVPDESVTAAAERAAGTVAQAVAEAKAAPPPDPGDACTDVWADGGSAVPLVVRTANAAGWVSGPSARRLVSRPSAGNSATS
jgi:TPP-dependent pyruvate/acetoin dehydrogenase alpha subunit